MEDFVFGPLRRDHFTHLDEEGIKKNFLIRRTVVEKKNKKTFVLIFFFFFYR